MSHLTKPSIVGFAAYGSGHLPGGPILAPTAVTKC